MTLAYQRRSGDRSPGRGEVILDEQRADGTREPSIGRHERQPKVDSSGCDEGITEARKNSPGHETSGAVRDLKRWWNERDEGGT